MSKTFPEPNSFTLSLFEKLKRHPKRIVFTEGEDLRILRVAEEMVNQEIGVPILLGDRDRITQMAEKEGIPLTFIKLINPKDSSDFSLFCDYYTRMENTRGVKVVGVRDTMAKPHNFGAMMVQYGHADALVGGNEVYPFTLFRAVMHMIKPVNTADDVFTTTLLVAPNLDHFGHDGMVFLSDTSMTPEPTSDELGKIAVETGKIARHLLGRKPRVVMLSHSTKGTFKSKSAEKMKAATLAAQQQIKSEYLDIDVDGELQADVALDPTSAEVKLHSQEKLEAPDVLVFPNLDASHISLKLLQHVGGATCYGNLIIGMTKPAAHVSRSACEETILGAAALVAVEAVKFNDLHLGHQL